MEVPHVLLRIIIFGLVRFCVYHLLFMETDGWDYNAFVSVANTIMIATLGSFYII